MVERGAQIQTMRKIFASATEVIVWLGYTPVDKDGTLNYMGDLKTILGQFLPAVEEAAAKDEHDLCKWEGDRANQEEFAELIGMPDFRQKLMVVAMLFRRCRWFYRQWCIQEVVLARRVRVFWASYEFSWDELGKLASTLRDRNWDSMVSGDMPSWTGIKDHVDWFGGILAMWTVSSSIR